MAATSDHDEALDEQTRNEKRLQEVHKRAIRRFDDTVMPQQEIRAEALLARRFIAIPGAMWEGDWGAQFENSVRVEIDKISKGVEKIVNDYRQNRIVPDFRPAGGNSDSETANTLDGLHRADSYHFKAQQARDNAFEEAAAGGMGAYRLTNEWADPYDKDSDAQRINPGLLIADADQRVFFDGNSKLYDKSDARFAFVLTAETKEAFEEEYEGRCTSWPDPKKPSSAYDWFAPDIVIKCEYYEVEDRDEKLLILTHRLSGEEQRHWSSDIDAGELSELEAQGWTVRSRRQKRRRVHKYLMSGAEVLKDQGYIAGDCIPIVPVYGKRWYVDNQERFRGHVSKRMDSQRIYNAKVSKLAETDALAPREKPIFLAQQMPPHLQTLWAEQEKSRHPYALVDPVIDPVTGSYVAMGPIGKVEPPQVAPVTAALLQMASADLTEDDQDADEVKANVSAEAMDIAATRVDAKSGIYLDNMRQSVQREGEIYLSMARDIYYEPGRVVETMTEDGDDGEAVLQETVKDKQGRIVIRNDFTRGRYKVIADVTEATATRRDKTVKSALYTADVATKVQDMELAQAALITAIANQEGEGLDDLQRFARKRGLTIGLFEPNEEEQQALAEAEENAAPDPNTVVAEAQAVALQAGARKDQALAGKAEADTALSRAKVVETLAKAGQPQEAPMARPRIRMGRELVQ